MCDISRVLCVLCACLVFRIVLCEDDSEEDRSGLQEINAIGAHNQPTLQSGKGNYFGRLTPDCVTHYWRIFVTRRIPPRTYLYFHEVMTPEQLVGRDDEPAEDSGPVDVQWRIVGGKQVSIKEVPYQVLYGLYCGGTIIAPDWVITAAHCKEKESYVLAGSTQRSLATKYSVCAHFIHPQWNTTNLHTHDYDYQLILLEKPIPVSANSRPIAIGNVEDIQEGEFVSVSGWGHTKYKQRVMQDIVRRVRVPVMSTETCKSLPLNNYKTITPRMFCAGLLNGTKDSCQGDSGGPAIMNGKLLGLVSFGVGCAMKEQPGVYSNIPLVRGWIRHITGLPL